MMVMGPRPKKAREQCAGARLYSAEYCYFHARRNVMQTNRLLSATTLSLGFLLLSSIGPANAADECGSKYATCQQTCRNHSAGGKDFGVSLWSASRSKDCFNGCSTERMQCKVQSANIGSATKKK
jgi:hypothetical protein